VALKSHALVCGKLVCQTCSKSYRATDGLEKHLRAYKSHVPTSPARIILEKIKRKPPPTQPPQKFTWRPNGPIRSRGTQDVGTQVELNLTTTSTGNSQTEIDYQFCETHEWGGQTTGIPWEDNSSGHIIPSRGDVHVTSTEIQTSHDDEFLLGNSSVRELFTTKPVEIQTDPIQTGTMNDMNLQTDFGELEWNDFQVEFDSAGTQTDFSLENLGLNLIQR